MNKCSLKCPINSNGKCLSGNAHKTDFDKDCKEREKLLEYYGLKEKEEEKRGFCKVSHCTVINQKGSEYCSLHAKGQYRNF